MGAEPGILILIYKKKPNNRKTNRPQNTGQRRAAPSDSREDGGRQRRQFDPLPPPPARAGPQGLQGRKQPRWAEMAQLEGRKPSTTKWLSRKWGLGHSSLEPQSPEEEPYSGWEKGPRVGSLPELRVVISTAEVGGGMCQGPHSPSYPPASLVPSGRGPSVPEGVGMRRAGPVCGLQLQRGAGVWRSPLALTPTGGERVVERVAERL